MCSVQLSFFKKAVILSLVVSCVLGFLLLAKASTDQLYTGPHVKEEILQRFFWYAVFSLFRLTLWAIGLFFLFSVIGSITYLCFSYLFCLKYNLLINIIFILASISAISFSEFANQLFYIPSSILMSFNYSVYRLIPIWELINPFRLKLLYILVGIFLFLPVLMSICKGIIKRNYSYAVSLVTYLLGLFVLFIWSHWTSQPPQRRFLNRPENYNILMIGSDTLRADRLGVNGNSLDLTPTIDTLAKKGVNFEACIVPIARTAPSLTSLLTSTWPQKNGIRFNFISDEQAALKVISLPKVLKKHGYVTAAVGDWAATDLAKLSFGFDYTSVPEDQWNLKYLLKQGPKDLRLFLTLFTHNNFGKTFLPELYYLAGIPLTEEIGLKSRHMLAKLASLGKPFMLNIFMASTHGPFGSKWPYYRKYTNPDYRGSSLFAMSGVSSPEEIVKAQEAGQRNFDVEQIINLYNGAVRSFDDEVSRILNYLHATGLDNNTIVVIYSDHGVDLFEGPTWGQGNILSDYSYRIPMIVYHPAKYHGVKINTTISSIDLAPTLLDMVGIKPPEIWDGNSTISLLLDSSHKSDRIAFAETGIWIANVPGLPNKRIPYPKIFDLLEVKNTKSGTLSIKQDYAEIIIHAKAKMARQGKWELVYFPLIDGEEYSLYNITIDPALRHDISGDYPYIVNKLRSPIINWMAR